MEKFWEGTEPVFHSTSALYRFSKKLKDLKPLLRDLRKEQIGDVTKKTKEAWNFLCDCQIGTLNNPSQALMEVESKAYDRWNFLSQLVEKILSQKAKIHWLDVGDGNNKQFYQAAKVREVVNSIREIKRPDDTVANTQDELKVEAVDHFNKFLNFKPENFVGISEEELQDLLGFVCKEEDQAMLMQQVSEGEIKKVLFAMAKDKSPGPDGYTSEFYKSAWPIIGKDFVVAVQSFFDKGFLPKGINSTILALIPKKLKLRVWEIIDRSRVAMSSTKSYPSF